MNEVEVLNDLVVQVSADGISGDGTGFYVSDNLIATCYHVLATDSEDLKSKYWVKHDDSSDWVEAEPVAEHCHPMPHDTAILRCAPSASINRRAPIEDWNKDRSAFVARGYDGRKKQAHIGATVVEGEILGPTTYKGRPRLQLRVTGGSVLPGRSGSPVWSANQGRIVGMMDFRAEKFYSNQQDLVLAIPVGDLVPGDYNLLAKEDKYEPAPSTPVFADTEGIFSAPQFNAVINRQFLVRRLEQLAEENPIVSVEGLPGTGKTYLVASFTRRCEEKSLRNAILWHNPERGETLDGLFSPLQDQLFRAVYSTKMKCKRLMHYLHSSNTLLVIDDFQSVDQASYADLLDMAASHGGKAHILVISQRDIDSERTLGSTGHLQVGGFSVAEVSRFLKARGLHNLDEHTINELTSRTQGLPLAANLFTALVLRYHTQPAELLAGTMLRDELLRNWFSRLQSQITDEDGKLLRFLSTSDGPFNRGIIELAGEHEHIAAPDQSFYNLQKLHLVEKYTPYRWTVHSLIAHYCVASMSPDDAREAHITFGRHYLRGFSLHDRRVQGEKEFNWKLRACRHFQSAGEYKESGRIIENICKTAKTLGYYEVLMQLCGKEIEQNPQRDSWIDYHYAHCCYITGRLRESRKATQTALKRVKSADATVYLPFARLNAEVMAAMGKQSGALAVLDEALSLVKTQSIDGTAVAQALSTKANVLIQLGRYDEANAIVHRLLANAKQREDKLGAAISLTLASMIGQRTKEWEVAYENAELSVQLFKEVHDKRGIAWSLTALATCRMLLEGARDRNFNAIAEHIREAIVINSEIGQCSLDYYAFLKQSRRWVHSRGVQPFQVLLSLIETEIKRVGATQVLDYETESQHLIAQT